MFRPVKSQSVFKYSIFVYHTFTFPLVLCLSFPPIMTSKLTEPFQNKQAKMVNFHSSHKARLWEAILDLIQAQSLRKEIISHSSSLLSGACAPRVCFFARMPEGHGARYMIVLIQVNWCFSSQFQSYRFQQNQVLNLLKNWPLKGHSAVLLFRNLRP